MKPQCEEIMILGIKNIESGFSFWCEKKNLDGNDRDNDSDGAIINIFRYILIKVKGKIHRDIVSTPACLLSGRPLY